MNLIRRVAIACLCALPALLPAQTQTIFQPIVMNGSGQTSNPINFTGPGGMQSYSSLTITLVGNNLTTATFSLLGSSNNGVTYVPVNLSLITAPGTTATSWTATANTVYQAVATGLTNVEFVTTGTFTANSITFYTTASPNAGVGGGGGGGGGSSGVSSINSNTGAFSFTGAGVTCTGTTCNFTGGSGSPSGSNYSIQYNNSSAFGGASFNGLVLESTTGPPTAAGLSAITALTGTGSTAVSNLQITLDEIPAGFSISSFSGGSSVEIGATVTNPVFTAAYSSTPTSASITNTDSINSPFTLTTPFTSATITGSFSHTAAATTTFTLTAIGTSTKTATQTINWYPRTFSGAGTAGAIGATASGTSAVLTGATGTLASAGLNNQSSYSCTASSNYCYVLMTGGSHTFTSGGFSFPMNTPTAVSFVNANGSTVTMYLYQSTNSLTGTFSLVVAS